MDAAMMIELWSSYFDKFCRAEIDTKFTQGERSFVLDYKKLCMYSPELGEALLDQSDECMKSANIAIESFAADTTASGNACVRFTNLTKTAYKSINSLRTNDIGKLLWIEARVIKKSKAIPKMKVVRFECPACQAIVAVRQDTKKMRAPARCGCGRKGEFKIASQELEDVQYIVVQDIQENLQGAQQPETLNIVLTNDLVTPMQSNLVVPGSTIEIIGLVKELPQFIAKGGQSTEFDFVMEANNIRNKDEEFLKMNINEQERKHITRLSKQKNVGELLVEAFAPSIYGCKEIKTALVLQLFSGVPKVVEDGRKIRGTPHILLVGEPGAAKTQLLLAMKKFAARYEFASGKGSSAAGLTASVEHDEFLGAWILKAGAAVMAHRGILALDEIDKINVEDTGALHEMMEQQTVTIRKASISATLQTETTVIAAGNPKHGRFDAYTAIASQINLPPALLNRFDLIFPVRDFVDEERDRHLVRHVLNAKTDGLNLKEKSKENPFMIDSLLVRKYIAVSREIEPQLSKEACDHIEWYYVESRKKWGDSTDESKKHVNINPRYLEGIMRLSEAHARIRLSKEVLKEDVQAAINLLHYSLSQVALDPSTGKIDVDIVEVGTSHSKRDQYHIMNETIKNIFDLNHNKETPIDELIRAVQEATAMSYAEIEELLSKQQRIGDYMEPRRGYFKRV